MAARNKKVAHLFHWPAFPEYQKSLLKVIALPVGARGDRLYYKEKWVNRTFINEVENINKLGGSDAIFWVLSCAQAKENDKIVTKFDFACPVRLLRVKNVEKKNDYYYINFIAQGFISKIRKITEKNALENYMKIKFDGVEIPCPGAGKGYAYTGPKIETETTLTPFLEALYGVLGNIPCSLEYKDGIRIDSYPLLKIETIEKSEINESGLYELSAGQEYEIAFSCYQGERYRSRDIYINGKRFTGKSISDKISIGEIRERKDKIDIGIECDELGFMIPLSIVVRIPWYRRRTTALLVLFGISAIVVLCVLKLLPKIDIYTKTVLFFVLVPLVRLLLNKIWEALTRKIE